VVLDLQALLVHRDWLGAKETLGTLASRVPSAHQVTLDRLVWSDGLEFLDRKDHVVFRVRPEIWDCLVSPDCQDCKDSRVLPVVQGIPEVVESLEILVSRVALVSQARRETSDFLGHRDCLDRMEQLASLDLQV